MEGTHGLRITRKERQIRHTKKKILKNECLARKDYFNLKT